MHGPEFFMTSILPYPEEQVFIHAPAEGRVKEKVPVCEIAAGCD